MQVQWWPTSDPRRGVYEAERAAALSGVPKSTIHYWARTELLVPSVSATRVKLWSWLDLVALRAIDWLRAEKPGDEPRVPVNRLREALQMVHADGGDTDAERVAAILVDTGGELFFRRGELIVRARDGRQIADARLLNLIDPYRTGPHLLQPRPRIRIIPGKVSGAPHIQDTRIMSRSLYALQASGYPRTTIAGLYPQLTDADIADALDLEAQLHAVAA